MQGCWGDADTRVCMCAHVCYVCACVLCVCMCVCVMCVLCVCACAYVCAHARATGKKWVIVLSREAGWSDPPIVIQDLWAKHNMKM